MTTGNDAVNIVKRESLWDKPIIIIEADNVHGYLTLQEASMITGLSVNILSKMDVVKNADRFQFNGKTYIDKKVFERIG